MTLAEFRHTHANDNNVCGCISQRITISVSHHNVRIVKCFQLVIYKTVSHQVSLSGGHQHDFFPLLVLVAACILSRRSPRIAAISPGLRHHVMGAEGVRALGIRP